MPRSRPSCSCKFWGGHFGIPLLLLTSVLSKKVQRHPMLVNFWVTWIIYTTSFTLVLYAGKQVGPEPPIELCVIQAAFIYGSVIMAPMAGLALVLHLWFSLQSAKDGLGRTAGGWRFMLLLGSPYILFLVFSIAMVVVGVMNEGTVSRSRYLFYCTINLGVVHVVPGTSGVIMPVIILFEVLTGIELYRRQKAFKTMGRVQYDGPPLHLFIRVGIFSTYSVLALVGCVAFWSATGAEFPYFVEASLPTAAFLVFGTQEDFFARMGNHCSSKIHFSSIPTALHVEQELQGEICQVPEKDPDLVNVVLSTSDSSRRGTVDGLPPEVPEKDLNLVNVVLPKSDPSRRGTMDGLPPEVPGKDPSLIYGSKMDVIEIV
ncbi:hypothetical protein MSAN_00535400 [Mycena sanguinolenta]|uniref:Uncharacterized protein n=1 Tax=Mycena sanguinolenta TaxID=230812 RepID=A0A8H6ZCP5_9AGAR|nr:hypothetical protein MSAN_00535400 [Mycena sanguinolenta]